MRVRPVALAATALSLSLVAACTGSSAPGLTTPSTTTSTTPGCGPGKGGDYTGPPTQLPMCPVTLRKTPQPWTPPALIDEGAQSADFVAAAGLPYAEEKLQVHYHAHLDIQIDGAKVTVPPYLGYVTAGTKALGLAPLHTHADDGIIHVENDKPAQFVLGQVFVEWGVRFSSKCLGPYCTGNGKELAVFLNGTRYTDDPTRLVLTDHQEIAIEYGDEGALPTPPASFDFP